MYNITPKAFCKNSCVDDDQSLFDTPVISFNSLKEKFNNSKVIINSSSYQTEIKEQLLFKGFEEENIYTIYSKVPANIRKFIDRWYVSKDDIYSYSDEIIEKIL